MHHLTRAASSLLGVAALVALAPRSGTAQTYYTNRAAFLVDPGVTTTTAIDFDGMAPGTDLTNQTVFGVTFGAPGSVPLQVILGSTGVQNPMIPSSGLNVLSPGGSDPALEEDDLTLTFATPVRAAGLDVVFDVPDGSSFTSISFFDTSNTLLFSDSFIPAPNGAPGSQFVGLVSSSANIARIVLDEFDPTANDDNVAYDSIVFSPAAAAPGGGGVIPEPGTVTLLVAGLLPLAGALRRGTRKRA